MIENWIDAVQDVWRGIQGKEFKTVFAPYLVKKAEFPSAIDAASLATQPIVLSMPGETQFTYSLGGPNEGFYQCVSEFHVAPSLDMGLIPSLLPWKRLIVQAAAAHAKLGGLVSNFVLQNRPDQITGPVALQYGDEQLHWGFIVYWEVKEKLNSQITFASGD